MYIENLISEVNSTHPAMGNLVAICQIIVKAHMFLLIVSPSGCGKSRAMEYIAVNTANSYRPLYLSLASLGNKVDMLNGFRSVIVLDDIANIQTMYMRNATINTLSALTYTHRIEPSSMVADFCIEDFYGSALIAIQPRILKDLMLSGEWESSIQDKSLRYYHLHRPLSPNFSLPSFKMQNGIDIENVNEFEPSPENKSWTKLITLGDSQWSRARTKEYILRMLKAVASLEGRKNVIDEDYSILLKILKPMAIESISVSKESLEGERYLNNDLLALLTEYYTYGDNISLGQISSDYKISMQHCYKIMKNQNGNWQEISKSPTIYTPSKNLITSLKKYGLEREKIED